MKWLKVQLLVNALCLILTSVLLCTVLLQQETITSLVSTERALVKDYARTALLQTEQRRRIDSLERDVVKLQRQADLIAAASRMGWSQAYKFLRGVESSQ